MGDARLSVAGQPAFAVKNQIVQVSALGAAGDQGGCNNQFVHVCSSVFAKKMDALRRGRCTYQYMRRGAKNVPVFVHPAIEIPK